MEQSEHRKRSLEDRDRELVQIVDAALDDAARRAGSWLACCPGCTQCCHGAFQINALDVLRLRAGVEALRAADPRSAAALLERSRAWLHTYGPEFPGDPVSGLLGVSEEDRERFEDFANDAPCPALNPASGLCDVYQHRPMTCRVFGPPTRLDEDGNLGCCELCFVGASPEEIEACEMPVPRRAESELLEAEGGPGETVVAFALLPQAPVPLSAEVPRT
jgi:Fe-S-cluster containining protein